MWTVIVPVKPAAVGKSRLRTDPQLADPELVRAIALDTIAAALAAARVERVLVVTADAALDTRAEIVVEARPSGLDDAIAAGLRAVQPGSARAVLLGDIPSLRPGDLDEALRRAEAVPTGFVADREGTGTALVTAAAGVEFRHAFGVDSARRHRQLGIAEIVLPAGSTVPLDVDTPEQLAVTAGLGPRTAAALRASPAGARRVAEPVR